MDFLDWLFPKTCIGCGKTGLYFCPSCSKTPTSAELICPVCEKPQPHGETHPNCQSKYTLSGLVYFFDYEKIIKQAIHLLKYRFASNLIDELMALSFTKTSTQKERFVVLEKFIFDQKPTVLPIPLFWQRLNYRGFNQADLIAQKIARHYALPISNKFLVRKQPTDTQTTLSFQNRKINIKGVFSVEISPPPASLLLIDDVWTTGATMKEACQTLKRAGVNNIWGITVAR